MSKYRKKPVVIEAMQYNGENLTDIMLFSGAVTVKITGEVIIDTLEGEMLVNKGDFVIKGVNREFYPCKPDIFEKSYELVN